MPVNSFDDYPMNWKPDLSHATGPLYKALAKLLESDIINGHLHPGDLLPPQRELADYLDINLSTVSKAFKLCMQKGLISSNIGKGTFVSSDVHVNATLLDPKTAEGLIELGAIHPSYKVDHYLKESLNLLLNEEHFTSYLQYTTPTGNNEAKCCGATWLKHAHIETTKDHILISQGAQNALCAILSSLFEPGDRIGTDPVIFAGFKTLAQMLGIKLVPIPFENNEMSPHFLAQYCKTEELKGIYLIPDYQNPTTHIMTIENRKKIAEVAKTYKLVVIEDAINSLYHPTPLPPIATFLPEQTIYISSLSKSINPALRIAFLYVPTAYYDTLERSLYNINLMASPLNAALACRLIRPTIAQKILNERQADIILRNALTDEILKDFTVLGDQYATFRLLLLPQGWTGKSFETCAKNSGVQLYCIERFAVGNSHFPPAVRLAISTPATISELKKGLTIIKELLTPSLDDFTPF